MTELIDTQLEMVIYQLDIWNVSYWLDSGSLLGIIRDGKLIDGDGDIDIGIWDYELDNVENLMCALEGEGYYVRRCYYNGIIIKYKLTAKIHSQRVIDVNVFRVNKLNSWCIQPIECYENMPLLKKKVYAFFVDAFKQKADSHYDRFPFKQVLMFGCWWVPKNYFESTEVVVIGDVEIIVPSDYEEYLCLRYGDWNTPNQSWDFVIDDGALLESIPKEVHRQIDRL